MKSGHFLSTFLLFGVLSLPSIHSDIFPPLFVVKYQNEDTHSYSLADRLAYGDPKLKNTFKFRLSSKYELYTVCPEQEAALYHEKALQIQQRVTEFEPRTLNDFIKGYFSKLKCHENIQPFVSKLKDTFRGKFVPKIAQVYDIGFLIHELDGDFEMIFNAYDNLNKGYDFIPSLTVILNRGSGTVISVRHMIANGRILAPNPPQVPLSLQFNEDNFEIYNFEVNFLYTENYQQKRFSSTFGDYYTTYYQYPTRMLSKVYLAPQEDFLLYVWKLPTFMDLNTAPMWSQLIPQWRKVEVFVRRVARELGALSVETGTAKILHLPDAGGYDKPVYLRPNENSPVPQYFWKLIKFSQRYDVDYTKAILIVMHNDPYTQYQKPICENHSAEYGWTVANEDYTTGVTYVCSVDTGSNVMTKLYDEFKMEYEILNLKDLRKLDYDEQDNVVWINEDVAAKINEHWNDEDDALPITTSRL